MVCIGYLIRTRVQPGATSQPPSSTYRTVLRRLASKIRGATSNSVEYDLLLLSNVIFTSYSPHIHLIFTSYSDGKFFRRIWVNIRWICWSSNEGCLKLGRHIEYIHRICEYLNIFRILHEYDVNMTWIFNIQYSAGQGGVPATRGGSDPRGGMGWASAGGEVARWRGGEVARWRGGEVARWRGGEVARWQGGEVAR